MTRATVRQCAVWLDRSTTQAHLPREFMRFGVTEFLLLVRDPYPGVGAIATATQARLPCHATIHVVAGDSVEDALFNARDRIDPRFLLARADTILDANLARLLAAARADGGTVIGRLLLRRGQVAAEGVLLRDDRVTGFGPSTLLHTGIGVFDRRLLDTQRSLPALASFGALRGTIVDAPGTRAASLPRRTLFLDRDGVINIDHHYVGTRDRFEWVPGAREAIAHATDSGWHVFIVTNQSGIARGRYTEADLLDLHAWLCDEVRSSGGTIDDVRYCPFHPDASVAAYRALSSWRKPAPGMLLDLIRAWELDPGRCLMIGDQETDMQAARAAGVQGHRFDGGNLLAFARPLIDANRD